MYNLWINFFNENNISYEVFDNSFKIENNKKIDNFILYSNIKNKLRESRKIVSIKSFSYINKLCSFKTYENRTPYRFYIIIKNIKNIFNLPNYIFEQIKFLFKSLINSNKKLGNKIVLLYSCFYYIIKKNNFAISLNEILDFANLNNHRVNKKLIFRKLFDFNKDFFKSCHRDYIKTLNNVLNRFFSSIEVLNKINFYEKRYFNKFNIFEYKKEVFKLCVKILEKLFKMYNRSFNDMLLISVIIYYSELEISKKNNFVKMITHEIITDLFHFCKTALHTHLLKKIYYKTYNKIK